MFHLHLVSDATGETINAMARACLAQYEAVKVQEHVWSLIRSRRQLDVALGGLKQWPGLVLYTFVDEDLRQGLESFCRECGIEAVPVLDPVMNAMARHFGVSSVRAPGKQHVLDEGYFARIEAMDYALARDDGHGIDGLEGADVILLGVSRTSKTPTCMYLANRGIKAANIPLIPGSPFPEGIERLRNALVVGLTKDPDSLIEIRRNRMHMLSEDRESDYIDPEIVRREVQEARRFFARIGCPVIDVSRRSIEETAAEIMMLLSRRAEGGLGKGERHGE
ncbi:MAG: pyruvate, water dikinase regulatory protein [Bdellovibrionales bacterium]